MKYNSMSTLVTADLHVSANPRDAYRWLFLEETLPALVAEHDVERILILGDLTEQKDGHSAALVNRLVDGIACLAETTTVYVLKGNHDYVAEDTPFYRFLGHLRSVRWVNAPKVWQMRGLGDCLFLPHARPDSTGVPQGWVEILNNRAEHDWFFCHQTFTGACGEDGRELVGVPHIIFPHNARIVSGDVHGPQKIGAVTYVGAPYSVDFGDDYEPRVLLLEGTKMRSVSVPGPQKRLVVIRSREDEYPDVAAGDVVKVRIEPPAGDQTPRAEWRAGARRWADAAGVQLYAVEVVAPKVSPTRMRDRHRTSDPDLVRAYAKKMKQGKAVVAAGLKLMEETP